MLRKIFDHMIHLLMDMEQMTVHTGGREHWRSYQRRQQEADTCAEGIHL